MPAITINNNFLRIASPRDKFFEKITLDSPIARDYKIIDQGSFAAILKKAFAKKKSLSKEVVVGLNEEKTHLLELEVSPAAKESIPELVKKALRETVPYKPSELYVAVKVICETHKRKVLQVVAVEKSLVESYRKAVKAAGLEIKGFVPLALSLANITAQKEKPHLVVCLEDNELVFVLVSENGAVPFSSTYALPSSPKKLGDFILEATTAVVEFGKDKYGAKNIRKIYICGENSKQVAKPLKKAGLVVEDLKISPVEFAKPISLLTFDDKELMLGRQELEGLKSVLSKADRWLESFKPREFPAKTHRVSKKLTLGKAPGKESDSLLRKESDSGGDSGSPVFKFLGIGLLLVVLAGAGWVFIRSTTGKKWSGPDKQTPERWVVPLALETPEATAPAVSRQEPQETTPSAQLLEVTPAAMLTPTPTAAPELDLGADFDKASYDIQILNGKRVTGVAARAKADLEELGYTVAEIGDTYWRVQSHLQVKEGLDDLRESLLYDLRDKYDFAEPEILEAESGFDAVLIVGSK